MSVYMAAQVCVLHHMQDIITQLYLTPSSAKIAVSNVSIPSE